MFSIFEIALQNANFEIVNVVIICIEMQWQSKKLFLSDRVCVIIKSVSDISASFSNIINELQPILQNDVLKLIPSHPRPATFYTIPKVHKLPNLVVSTCPSSNPDNFIIEAKRLNINPPGRPIVSGIGTLTEYVSAFVDRELQQILADIPSYIEDTTDFLNKLNRFDN